MIVTIAIIDSIIKINLRKKLLFPVLLIWNKKFAMIVNSKNIYKSCHHLLIVKNNSTCFNIITVIMYMIESMRDRIDRYQIYLIEEESSFVRNPMINRYIVVKNITTLLTLEIISKYIMVSIIKSTYPYFSPTSENTSKSGEKNAYRGLIV